MAFGGLIALVGLMGMFADPDDMSPGALLAGLSLVVTGLVIGVIEKIYSVLYEMNERQRTGM